MAYIDGFVIAVPTADKQQFIEHAEHFDALFIEMGENMHSGPRRDPAKNPMPLDGKRMVFVGFEPVVSTSSPQTSGCAPSGPRRTLWPRSAHSGRRPILSTGTQGA